jgi:hypothetical protein
MFRTPITAVALALGLVAPAAAGPFEDASAAYAKVILPKVPKD